MGKPLSLKQNKGIFGYGLLLLLATLHSNPVNAQDFKPLTPQPSPSKEPEPLPRQENPLDRSLEAPPIPGSVLDIPGTIMIKKFDFVGNTVFSQAELNQAIANFTGKPISFAQLVQAANVITKLYVSQGYITSGAYIPEQSLTAKTVQIQIVEGSLAEIDVQVREGRIKESYIRDRLTPKNATPLNISQLQSSLQRLQLNPLIKSINAELSTGIEPGTNRLKVAVISADSFSLNTRINNNRNVSIGSFERGIELEEANLMGIGDKFRLAYKNTDGSNQYSGGYTFPLNRNDGSLGFNFRLGKNQIVQSSFEDIDIEIESRDYDLTWRQPIFTKATSDVSQELALDLSAARRESDSTIMGEAQPLTPGADENGEIRTSVLGFGQEWLQRNRRQVISARSQFNLGLDVLGATAIQDEPNSQFFSWRGQLSYLRLLSTPQEISAIGSTILLRSELQLSADALISTEQFSLGGDNTVRGYRQDALLTDNGFFAAAELRLPIARFPKLNATLQLTPFIDFGTGWNTDDQETEFDTLIGTGLGLLLQTPEEFTVRLDWGTPLINRDSPGGSLQEDGVYFQLQYDLL
jgi:hemolysin activation/secretion protein